MGRPLIVLNVILICIVFATLLRVGDSFAPNHLSVTTVRAFDVNHSCRPQHRGASLSRPFPSTRIFAATSDEVDINKMRAGEIRKELESYGISTKSFFEKSELVEALKKARAEGKTPINNGAKATTSGSNTSSSSSGTPKSASDSGGQSREDKIKAEVEKIRSMKVLEMKKELNDMGVSTKSFFEKSEFIKALAEARVDGVKKGGAGGRRMEQEEEYDPSYRDVVMQRFNMDPRDPRMRGALIDIRLPPR